MHVLSPINVYVTDFPSELKLLAVLAASSRISQLAMLDDQRVNEIFVLHVAFTLW